MRFVITCLYELGGKRVDGSKPEESQVRCRLLKLVDEKQCSVPKETESGLKTLLFSLTK